MKKLTRKALITIITIAVVFVVLGTATFAWITINNLASVRGMRMEVDTTNALQIEEETEIVEANFTNTVVNPGRNQIKYLQPVSSVDGKSFFYTQYLLTGVDGNGQLNDEAKLEEYDEDDFAMLYENVYPDVYAQGRKVQGYAEYTFILKAYASTDDIDVYLNEINFFAVSPSAPDNKTFRMAVLTKNLPGYASGQFADVEYNSLGIIASKEGSAARSIKNNQEYLAFGKTTAGDITVNSTDTIKMYTTNYGNVLFSDDATNFFTDANKNNSYDLVLATAADARIELGDTTKLKGEEKVVGISKTLVDGRYEFKTNLGTTVYGDNAESARNDFYYIKNGNSFEAYTMLKEHEVIDDQVAAEEVTLLNGLTFYKLTTKFLDENNDPTATAPRILYCASENPDNAPLFVGNATTEVVTAKDSYYEFVKEFDSTQSLMHLAQGKTGYVLVTLRIWVEGEDQDCTNYAYTTLGKDYQMNVKFGTEAPANGLYLN